MRRTCLSGLGARRRGIIIRNDSGMSVRDARAITMYLIHLLCRGYIRGETRDRRDARIPR